MMTPVNAIPTFGFARGAVVRQSPCGPNMLVVRGFETTTMVVVIEGDRAGQVRLRELQTASLHQVLAAQTPIDKEDAAE